MKTFYLLTALCAILFTFSCSNNDTEHLVRYDATGTCYGGYIVSYTDADGSVHQVEAIGSFTHEMVVENGCHAAIAASNKDSSHCSVRVSIIVDGSTAASDEQTGLDNLARASTVLE